MRTADRTSAHRTPNVARTPAIELAGVSKTFNARSGNPLHALKDANLTVQPGEIIALLGTNGAGKTTLVDIILGLTTPTSGTVKVMGQTPKQAVNNQNLGALMQTGGPLNDLTVKDTLKMIAAGSCRVKDVRLLLEHGANIHALEWPHDYTAADKAVAKSYEGYKLPSIVETLSFILDAGAHLSDDGRSFVAQFGKEHAQTQQARKESTDGTRAVDAAMRNCIGSPGCRRCN